MLHQLRCDEYTVGWVCALPVELAAAEQMLDEVHKTPQPNAHDTNGYTCGRIGEHNIVIACLPQGRIGTTSAAFVAAQMRSSFTSIRFGLMVGIGGGVPSEEVDIRLGDVVISKPLKAHSGVVQYDSGKATPSGFERTGSLNAPPTVLLGAVAKMQANHMRGVSSIAKYLSKFESLPSFTRDAAGSDILFYSTYDHVGGATCNKCDTGSLVARELRRQEVMVHYGTIASGSQVIKSAAERDRISADLGGVLCFEMEAVGLMNEFPCLVIRGICDYADSHKNKTWQPYAAATAAACAKEVLSLVPVAEVAKAYTVNEVIREASAVYYIRFPKNKKFVGRRAELQLLQQRLMVDKDCQNLSIVGLGGTGKTQVALQFAYAVKELWPEYSIFWVSALSKETFEQDCVNIAQALGILKSTDEEKDAKKLVKQHLSSSRAGPWLLVVDNADDIDLVIGSVQSGGIVDDLPENEGGVLVYTTRTLEVAVQLTGNDVIGLEAMDRQDAVDFLTSSLIRKGLHSHTMINKLLDELTCLPLAISQAAAYLNINRMPIAKYLRMLQSTEKDIVNLMSREFRDNTRYKESASAVATTWIVSFNQLRERDIAAATLLAFISCVEWKAIPRSLLPKPESEVDFDNAIGTLQGYSFLVRQEEEELYDMHRLVHLATRIWISKHDDAVGIMKRAVQHVAYVFPYGKFENRAVWRTYMPHAIRLLESDQEYNIKAKSELALRIGVCLEEDGRIREAVRWLEESCRLRNGLDEGDSDRLESQHELATACREDGQVKKAVELIEYVVEIREKVLAEEHP
ncbi:TPR repeat protein, partial [Phaeosphaeriaceae sp. PMI808]